MTTRQMVDDVTANAAKADGLIVGQDALLPSDERMYIFVAKFSYGEGKLAKVQVVKETPKTFKIGDCENVLGHQYLGKRLHKDQKNIFRSHKKAMAYLVRRAETYATSCEVKLESAIEELRHLKGLSDAE